MSLLKKKEECCKGENYNVCDSCNACSKLITYHYYDGEYTNEFSLNPEDKLKIKQENEMKLDTGLEMLAPLDILLSPENATTDKIINILKDSGHEYFDDIEDLTEEDSGFNISYYGGFYIKHSLQHGIIGITTYDRLKDQITDCDVLKLLNTISNYWMIQNRVVKNDSYIGIESRYEMLATGGISEKNFIESVKLFTSEYSAMRSMYMGQYLYDYDD